MWPWAHVGVAYLAIAIANGGRSPSGPAVLVAGFGAILPDLIDKPLAWYVGVLPYGRSLAHSLLLGGAFVTAGVLLAYRYHQGTLAAPFALGYLLHLLGDAYHGLITAQFGELGFLGWPLTRVPATETVGLVAHLQSLTFTPFFMFESLLTVVGLALWWMHGRPGLGVAFRWLGLGFERVSAVLMPSD